MRRFVAIALSSMLMLQAAPLLAGPARAGGVQLPVAPGTISGTARTSGGQILPNYTVQLRDLQTGQLVGSTKSDASGRFSFAGLPPANYVVELVNPAGAIAGSSAYIAVGSGTTNPMTVSLATAENRRAGAAGAPGGGVSRALVITTVAVAAGITGVVVISRGDASASR